MLAFEKGARDLSPSDQVFKSPGNTDGLSSPMLQPTWNESGVIDSILHILLKLEDALVEENGEFDLVGEIKDSAWEAMQNYARIIEKIRIPDPRVPGYSTKSKISTFTYLRLAQLQDISSPLFPSLCSVSIMDSTSSLVFLPLFLSPSLTHLQLTGLNDANRASSTRSFLKMLGSQGTLKYLSLDSAELSTAMLKAITSCRNLERIGLTNILEPLEHHNMITMLALPLLVDIHLHNKTHKYLHNPMLAKATARNALQKITIHVTGPFSMIRDAIHYLRRCELQNLRFNITCHVEGSLWTEIGYISVQTMLNSLDFKSLKSFTLAFDYQTDLTFPSIILDVCLVKFASLETLDISGMTVEDLNVSLQKHGHCWPALTHLGLPLVDSENVDCTISMATLSSLSKSCPNLTFLRALIDHPKTNMYFDSLATSGIRFPHLRTLSVGSLETTLNIPDTLPLPIDKSQVKLLTGQELCRVGRNLLRIFPTLHKVQTNEGFFAEVWADLRAIIDLCRETSSLITEAASSTSTSNAE